MTADGLYNSLLLTRNGQQSKFANEFARRGSALVSKWTIGRILALGNYFEYVPQKVPLIAAEHKPKRKTWCIVLQIKILINRFLRTLVDLNLHIYPKKMGKYWTSSKMVPKFKSAVTVWGGIL